MCLSARAVRGRARVYTTADRADVALALTLQSNAARVDLMRPAAATERLVVATDQLDRRNEIEATQELPDLLGRRPRILHAPLTDEVDRAGATVGGNDRADPLVHFAALAFELDADRPDLGKPERDEAALNLFAAAGPPALEDRLVGIVQHPCPPPCVEESSRSIAEGLRCHREFGGELAHVRRVGSEPGIDDAQLAPALESIALRERGRQLAQDLNAQEAR